MRTDFNRMWLLYIDGLRPIIHRILFQHAIRFLWRIPVDLNPWPIQLMDANILRLRWNTLGRCYIDIQIWCINFLRSLDPCIYRYIISGEWGQISEAVLCIFDPTGMIRPRVSRVGQWNRWQIFVDILIAGCHWHIPEDQETGGVQSSFVWKQVTDLMIVTVGAAVGFFINVETVDWKLRDMMN